MSDGITDYWRAQGRTGMTTSDSMRPLTAEDEASVRDWLASPEFMTPTLGHGVAALGVLPQLVASLDEARAGSLDAAWQEAVTLGHVYRRDLYNELVRWFDREAEDRGTPLMLYISGSEWPATPAPQLMATVAAQLVEKWLTEVYQPALAAALREAQP